MLNRKTLKNKLDKVCSLVTRSRGVCSWCGNDQYEKLQAAHIFTRSNLAVRWDFDNLVCLCAGCHFKAHLNPILFAEFIKEYLGKAKYESLKRKASKIKKWNPQELKALLETYQQYNK